MLACPLSEVNELVKSYEDGVWIFTKSLIIVTYCTRLKVSSSIILLLAGNILSRYFSECEAVFICI